MLRGITTSTGFAAFALGATLSAAVYAMGTVNLLEEIASDRGFSCLAKPSSIDPKNQSEAYDESRVRAMRRVSKEILGEKRSCEQEVRGRLNLSRPHQSPSVNLL